MTGCTARRETGCIRRGEYFGQAFPSQPVRPAAVPWRPVWVGGEWENSDTPRPFDQILQFGAIRMDAELHEVGRFEIRCMLLPHVVPSPKGLLINGTDGQLSTAR